MFAPSFERMHLFNLKALLKKMDRAYPNMGKKMLIPRKLSWNLKFLVETGDLKNLSNKQNRTKAKV